MRKQLIALWQGPAEQTPALKLEWRLVAVRWLGIILVTLGLFLSSLEAYRLVGAFAVLSVAIAYNSAVSWLLQKRPWIIASGYVTTFGDTFLNIAMIIGVGGSFNSPFVYLMFTSVISVAMRYGYGPSLAVSALFIGFNLVSDLIIGESLDSSFVFRSSLLILTVLLASYLREQAHQAEAALAGRLRQASALNAATNSVGASLEFEPVLQSVATATAHLFGSEWVVLIPTQSGLDNDAATGHIYHPQGQPAPLHTPLAEICRRYARQPHEAGQATLVCDSLPDARPVTILKLVLPTQRGSVATLAMAWNDRQQAPTLDDDILAAFVERVALAIENALLYRTLASHSHDLQRAYADLAMAHQDLLSLDEMKTNFLANVSHELRTPLSSIRAFSELLLSYEEDKATQREFLEIINSESERLTRLVNDVLDITKIEAGHIDWQMQTVDLSLLLGECARTYGPLIAERQLTFKQEIEPALPAIFGDRDRLQQVVSNLLNNAMKFTQHGQITLSARVERELIEVSVRDTGIGIPTHDLERIFEKFQQVGDTLTDKPRGTGLGLTICRDIVTHHGGTLWVTSELGVGSIFSFSIPAQQASRVAPTAISSSEANQSVAA